LTAIGASVAGLPASAQETACGHEGSPEAEARMNARYEKKKARLNAVKAAG